MTYSEFYQGICALPSKCENRDLKSYLSALYLLVEKNRETELDAERLLFLIELAFTSPEIQFVDQWLEINEAPEIRVGCEQIEFTLEVLKFQIAELHKMTDKQLNAETRYFGITSGTGHLWYNFDPFSNLECGTASVMENFENDDREMDVDWQTLGELLEAGRRYE